MLCTGSATQNHGRGGANSLYCCTAAMADGMQVQLGALGRLHASSAHACYMLHTRARQPMLRP
jgi:hypothetical protein